MIRPVPGVKVTELKWRIPNCKRKEKTGLGKSVGSVNRVQCQSVTQGLIKSLFLLLKIVFYIECKWK